LDHEFSDKLASIAIGEKMDCLKRMIALGAIALMILTSRVIGEDDHLQIPPGAWEASSRGFSFARILTKRAENGHLNGIELRFKNTSTKTEYIGDDGRDGGLILYYLDAQGAKIPLRHCNNDRFASPGDPIAIQPGQTLSRTVILTSDELALVKSREVGCWVLISNQETGGYQKVEFSVKTLLSVP
jgi:hypothetical protein